jgi:hypothetical protein
MRIDIEEYMKLREEIKRINFVNIEDIEIYKNNKKIDIRTDIVKEFKYTGLNNMDFVVMFTEEEHDDFLNTK